MRTYQEFYATIEKPFFAPPTWLFGPVWSVLYILIGIAFVLTIINVFKKKLPVSVLIVFILNLICNAAFTPLQLGFEAFWPASLCILAVLGTIIALEVMTWKKARIISWLLLPYLLWVSFATILQLSIAWMQ